jgi:hypothetical protein
MNLRRLIGDITLHYSAL